MNVLVWIFFFFFFGLVLVMYACIWRFQNFPSVEGSCIYSKKDQHPTYPQFSSWQLVALFQTPVPPPSALAYPLAEIHTFGAEVTDHFCHTFCSGDKKCTFIHIEPLKLQLNPHWISTTMQSAEHQLIEPFSLSLSVTRWCRWIILEWKIITFRVSVYWQVKDYLIQLCTSVLNVSFF